MHQDTVPESCMEYPFHGCSGRVSAAQMPCITTKHASVIQVARRYTEVDPCINSSYKKTETEFKSALPNSSHFFALLRDKYHRLTLMPVIL